MRLLPGQFRQIAQEVGRAQPDLNMPPGRHPASQLSGFLLQSHRLASATTGDAAAQSRRLADEVLPFVNGNSVASAEAAGVS
jgi:hypothetical protein